MLYAYVDGGLSLLKNSTALTEVVEVTLNRLVSSLKVNIASRKYLQKTTSPEIKQQVALVL